MLIKNKDDDKVSMYIYIYIYMYTHFDVSCKVVFLGYGHGLFTTHIIFISIDPI